MLFSNNLNTDIKLCISSHHIKKMNVNFFVGLFIDNKLYWKHHVFNISNKCSKYIGILHKTEPILNEPSLRILHFSTFLAYVSYCADVWGNTYKSTLQQIFLEKKKQ